MILKHHLQEMTADCLLLKFKTSLNWLVWQCNAVAEKWGWSPGIFWQFWYWFVHESVVNCFQLKMTIPVQIREQVPVSKDRPSLQTKSCFVPSFSTSLLLEKNRDFTSALIRFVKNGTGFPNWNVVHYIGLLLDLILQSCLVVHSISRGRLAVQDLLKLLSSCFRKMPS